MNPRVSIIMGSTSDLAIMEKAAKVLDDMGIPFEMNALSAHRTPAEVEAFAKQAAERGIEVIIAGAGMAAHLPGVIAAMTPVPGDRGADQRLFERNGCFVGYYSDASGNSCRYSGYHGAMNAGILAVQILAVGDRELKEKMIHFKESLKKKIVDANKELAAVKYNFKTN